jgi:exosome complex component RRP40
MKEEVHQDIAAPLPMVIDEKTYEENKKTAENLLSSLEKNVDFAFQSFVTLPGDDLTEIITQTHSSVKIGSGLLYSRPQEQIVSTGVGEVAYRPPSTYWVKSSSKRYFPKVNDQIIGIIEEKGGDYYSVNVFSGHSNCLLNRLAFEGATKRNRPELKKGDVVYCRVLLAPNGTDNIGGDIMELSCISSTGSTKEWSSGETVFGVVSQGLVVHVNSNTARRLLRPDCAVLNALGRLECFISFCFLVLRFLLILYSFLFGSTSSLFSAPSFLSSRNFVFEIAVGVNGAIWFRSPNSHLDMIIIRNALLNCQYLDDQQCEAMVEKLVMLSKKTCKK